MEIAQINPETLHANPAFTQVVSVSGAQELLFVGGQNGIDVDGKVVGDDLRSQTAQALRNVLFALDAAGAKQEHVVRMAIYVVAGHDVREAFAAAQEVWGRHATAITVLAVVALANPAFLVEIEATAAIDSGSRG